MAKKHDLPAMPFYFGDWRKAPEIRALDLDVRMIWFEMIGYMWESTERGYLTINGKPPTHSTLARMIGIDITKLQQALQQLSEFDVYSVRTSDGAIYSRKMVHNIDVSEKRAGAGKKGMKSRYSKQIDNKHSNIVITKSITNTENEIEYENEIESVLEKEGLGEKTNPPSIADTIPSSKAYSIYDITRYLNSKTGGSLNPEHRAYCSIILQRLDEGISLDQLRAVIDRQVNLWLSDPKMRGYLVPTTLFGDNFDKYLNDTRPLTAQEPVSNHEFSYDQP